METLNMKKVLILLFHAFVVWGLCAAVMGIGMASTTLEKALIIHAIAAPIIVIAVSSLYYWKFYYTTPLQTAIVFVSLVILMDVFLVAMVINKSFDMFRSFIGTWLPFILIFTSTYLTGVLWKKTKI
jgi:small-conductance mechanosensitive channel